MADRGFIPRLESLRGMAALMVACFHTATLTAIVQPTTMLGAYAAGGFDALTLRIYMGLANGFGAVVFFFVLSGFVLARSLDRSIGTDNWLVHFAIARVFRLFPPVIAAVAIFTLLFFLFGVNEYSGSFDPVNVLLNMSLLKTDLNRVMWSMQLEVLAASLIVAGVLVGRRFGLWPIFAFNTLLFGFSFFRFYIHAIVGETGHMGPLYGFLTGVMLYFSGARLAGYFAPKQALLILGIAVLVFCTCGALTVTGWTILLEVLSAGAVITCVVWHAELPVFSVLDAPFARFYGRISYSFYLLNPLALWVTVQFTEPFVWAHASGVPLFIVVIAAAIFSIVITTPLAYLCREYIELPSIRLGRAITARRPSQAIQAVE